jgi:integrase
MQTFLPIFTQQHVAQLKDKKNVEARLRLYFTPLASTPFKELTRLQILEWFNAIAAYSPAQANHCLSLLRTMYVKAQAWGLYDGENKAKYIQKRPKHNREVYVQPHEMIRLFTALNHAPLWLQAYVRLCLFVGCRPGEARAVRWCDLEFFDVNGTWQGRWNKPKTKTTAHTIPIPSDLATRLSTLPRVGSFVFQGASPHAPIGNTTLFDAWEKVRQEAGLPHIHLHDLRRTCATYLADEGANLSIISKGVLNHTNLQTTSIYVQQMQEPVARALEAHAQALRKMGG